MYVRTQLLAIIYYHQLYYSITAILIAINIFFFGGFIYTHLIIILIYFISLIKDINEISLMQKLRLISFVLEQEIFVFDFYAYVSKYMSAKEIMGISFFYYYKIFCKHFYEIIIVYFIFYHATFNLLSF